MSIWNLLVLYYIIFFLFHFYSPCSYTTRRVGSTCAWLMDDRGSSLPPHLALCAERSSYLSSLYLWHGSGYLFASDTSAHDVIPPLGAGLHCMPPRQKTARIWLQLKSKQQLAPDIQHHPLWGLALSLGYSLFIVLTHSWHISVRARPMWYTGQYTSVLKGNVLYNTGNCWQFVPLFCYNSTLFVSVYQP